MKDVVDIVLVVVIAPRLFDGHKHGKIVLMSLLVVITRRLILDGLPEVDVVITIIIIELLLHKDLSDEVCGAVLRLKDPIIVECDVSLYRGSMAVLLLTNGAC